MSEDRRGREEARLREAYARRSQNVPADRYALYRPEWIHIRSMQHEAIARALLEERAVPFERRRVLEVGCGDGQWLVDFESMGATRECLAGIDLDAERLAKARARLPGADLKVGNADDLPWPTGYFDLVFQSTVFTSVLDASTKRDMAREMARVLAPGGLILWYDFLYDNPLNRDVRGVGKREIRALFPGFRIRLKRVTLAPPLARRLALHSRTLATMLERLTILNTHYLGVLRRT